MEFGKNWLQPIQSRLAIPYKFLSNDQLDYYDSISRKAMRDGIEFIANKLTRLSDNQDTIKQGDLKKDFIDFILARYSWINKSNLAALFSKACYYAGKDGLFNCVR